jgi:hypothetical protein
VTFALSFPHEGKRSFGRFIVHDLLPFDVERAGIFNVLSYRATV